MGKQIAKNLRFFIVDDDPFSRMLYHQHLINLGYKNNVLFENGDECINQLNLKPDIVLLDYDMKPYNGLQILQIIKKFNPNIQLILVSAISDARVATDAIRYGAVDYIVKGDEDIEMITLRINEILGLIEGSSHPNVAN